MLNVNWILFRLLKLDCFKCRSLTEGEINICKTVFGDLIDYHLVKIMNHPYLPWQPAGILMAPEGYLHLKDADYCDDFSQQNLAYQAIFVHEMAHIYQFQRKVNVLFQGAILQIAFYGTLGKYNPYKYMLKADKAYFDYNIEQQGDIAKDIFLKKIPNIILPPTTYQ
ncbi:hypothetical protein [Acinetobacter sp. ANC 4648]|uniref:hypothetical protein n=1 Tax=Acinetobacter sp. ANC 4648 TaxID=1977875 RepID=UPI000A34352B|nr:hypothetical protein [Acinetobacter sp. ANC 4648]OTG81762.1 hypothetical protein B9T27_10900 [Acinetobacter sp. ANC 4648]